MIYALSFCADFHHNFESFLAGLHGLEPNRVIAWIDRQPNLWRGAHRFAVNKNRGDDVRRDVECSRRRISAA